MKTNFLVIPLMLLGIVMPAIADDSQKIEHIRDMYKDALIDELFHEHVSSVISLFKFASPPLQKSILLAYGQTNYNDGSLTPCGETLFYYGLQEGNSYDISEIDDLDIKILSNGKIRTIATVENMSPPGIRDYSVTCSGDECAVIDAYESDGSSAIESLGKYCT